MTMHIKGASQPSGNQPICSATAKISSAEVNAGLQPLPGLKTGLAALGAILFAIVTPAAGQAPAPGSCSVPVTIQAEDAMLGGAQVAKSITGYQGTGYVVLQNPGETVTFNACAPSTGFYTLLFRYANGTHQAARRTLSVDGVARPENLNFRSRYQANDWTASSDAAEAHQSVWLVAGTHTITVSHGYPDTGSVNLDSMTVQPGTSPSNTSATSIMMNDWHSLVVTHQASRVQPQVNRDEMPRIGDIHWGGDWSVSQVNHATGYFRDDQTNTAYLTSAYVPMETAQWMTPDGVVVVDYLGQGDAPLPANITKEYAVVPNRDLIVVRYRFKNATPAPRSFSFLEYVDLFNKGTTSGGGQGTAPSLSATYQPDSNAWIANMHETNGSYLVFGAFEKPDVHSAAATANDLRPADRGHGMRSDFAAGSLANKDSASEVNLAVALEEKFTLAPGETTERSFYYSVHPALSDAQAGIQLARSRSSADWFKEHIQAWQNWLSAEVHPPSVDAATKQAYDLALVTAKEAQQPVFGSILASTNPSYSYKVWVRDAAVTAMGLDAAGFRSEAEKYWRWMASVQAKGDNPEFPKGTWWTTYSFWDANQGISFVSPEWDSFGLFMIGTYRHFLDLQRTDAPAARDFAGTVMPAVANAAEYIVKNIDPKSGLGPQDYSIWEEDLEWATFTQVTYASGLAAAAQFATAANMPTDRAGAWSSAAQAIKNGILRPFDSAACAGLYNAQGKYFNRGIYPDCRPDERVDGSTGLIWVFGLLPADDARVASHRDAILAQLTPSADNFGVSRYQNDAFYYITIFNPGGVGEAQALAPVWPQPTMYVAMLEHWRGADDLARAREAWYTSVTCSGFVPTGEAVDWTTQQPLASTAAEPVSGMWYVLALLNQTGMFDPRLAQAAASAP